MNRLEIKKERIILDLKELAGEVSDYEAEKTLEQMASGLRDLYLHDPL